MAIEEGIDIRIGADIAPAQKGLADLQAQLRRLQIALQRASDPKVMDALEEGVNKTKLAIANLTPAAQNMSEAIAGSSTTSVTGSSIRAQYALNGLERGMRSLSTGSMSGAIFGAQQFAREFANLSATAGGTAGAMAKLSAMLFSPSPIGLIFGIGAIIELVSALVKKYGSLDAAVSHLIGTWTDADQAHQDFLEVLKAAAKEYDKSYSSLQRIREEINLANQGYLSAKGVLADYNKTLGDTFGKTTSLKDAEQKLIDKGPAFLQMELQKAIAMQAYEQAAKAAMQIEETRFESLNEQITFFDKIKATLISGTTPTSYIGLLYGAAADHLNEAKKNLTDFQKIGDDAMQKMAEIAKAFKLNPLDPEKDKKPKADNSWKKRLEEIKKAAEAIEKVYSKIAGNLMYFYDPLTRISAGINQKLDKNAPINPAAGFSIPFLAELQKAADEYQKFFKSSLFESDKFKIAFPKIDLTNLTESQAEAIEKFVEMRKKITNIFTSIGNLITQNLTQSFSQFFTILLSGGKNAFQSLMKGLEQLIVKLIATAMASAIVAVLLSAIGIGGVDAAGGIAKGISLGASFKNLFGGMMGFANGGVISGPTMAMIGEYPGAASNPEVVAPLDKLQNIMGNGGGNGYIATAKISGNDLWIGLQRAAQRRDRIS